jgi:tRNA threonylcarbamoyl adenosine modification protein YjeE
MKPGMSLEPESSRSTSAEQTERLGGRLAQRLLPGDVVLLEGDLAAGKTTLVRGLVRALGGLDTEVASPTFVLLLSYTCPGPEIRTVHHVDLYRLGEKIADLREIGLEDVLSAQDTIVAVEWPKKTLARWIPTDSRIWRVAITTDHDDSRRIEITPPQSS